LGVAGCLWVSLGVSGCLWVSLGVSGCLWVSLGVSGYLWVSLGVSGCRATTDTEHMTADTEQTLQLAPQCFAPIRLARKGWHHNSVGLVLEQGASGEVFFRFLNHEHR
jgi:hypothetical protein